MHTSHSNAVAAFRKVVKVTDLFSVSNKRSRALRLISILFAMAVLVRPSFSIAVRTWRANTRLIALMATSCLMPSSYNQLSKDVPMFSSFTTNHFRTKYIKNNMAGQFADVSLCVRINSAIHLFPVFSISVLFV